MTPKTLRFIFDVPLRQWSTRKKEGKTKIQKFEHVKNEKRFLDEIKRIFHNYLRAISFGQNVKNSTQKTLKNNFKKYRQQGSEVLASKTTFIIYSSVQY